jgi:acid phosphatase (class A)
MNCFKSAHFSPIYSLLPCKPPWPSGYRSTNLLKPLASLGEYMGYLRNRFSVLAISLLPLSACQTGHVAAAKSANAPSPEVMIQAARASLSAGYLTPGTVPDSLLLLPLPPAAGSAAEARDVESSKAAMALRGSARWDLAMADAELFSPTSTAAMSCAAGFAIGEKQTPAIQKLLRRAMPDLGLSGYGAKNKYKRARPFMVNGQPSCTPDWETKLRQDGSYPSGHSAIGYGWGLILAEIVPDHAAQLVARGRAFGDSRRICNVHWLSDVEEGRVTATAAIARMHAEPAFLSDIAAAKAEFTSLKAQPPQRDCGAEAAALAL